ncbi:hypothetical protein PC129_g15867 [Phytophthora cactorum]|uniref:Uncharacterized protein n=1 Tax=Phytophthora cactorum TaxID=29920 RepID=A0A8T1HLH6_9STRA|nr:hypothetical protein PC129_g15867 [Phytophthora cactorum]
MERPQRACASRMHRPQDVTNEGSGRSDSDSSWDVDSADTSSSSASVGDSGLSDTSRSRTSEFDSWESFHAYLDLNQKETYQVLRMHSTKSIVERNKKSRMARTLHRRPSQISGRYTAAKASDHDKKCDSWDARGRSMHASKW